MGPVLLVYGDEKDKTKSNSLSLLITLFLSFFELPPCWYYWKQRKLGTKKGRLPVIRRSF